MICAGCSKPMEPVINLVVSKTTGKTVSLISLECQNPDCKNKCTRTPSILRKYGSVLEKELGPGLMTSPE